MSVTIQNSGPGGKTRRTKVARHAYFVPFDNGGEGGWRFLPIDRAHGQMLEGMDEENNPTRPENLYEAKGFIPVQHVRDEEALAKLPLNWRDVANRGAEPKFAADAKK